MALRDEQIKTFRTGIALLTAWSQARSDEPTSTRTSVEIAMELMERGDEGIMEGLSGLQNVAGLLLLQVADHDGISMAEALQRLALQGENMA